MRVLLVGDVVGRPGRRAFAKVVPRLRNEHQLDLVVVNGENAAGGFGLTVDTAHELLDAGADAITSGNHIWDQREFVPQLDGELPLMRPANYPEAAPGRGSLRVKGFAIINLQGRVFMPEGLDSPFETVDRLLAEMENDPPRAVLVDFHTEATSEQGAMGWYLDGRVSAVVGTHTHVPTADAKLLPGGTAFVSDLGMTGPLNSVIGNRVEDVLGRFLTAIPRRLSVPEEGPVQFNSVMVELDDLTGAALGIQRLDEVVRL